MLSLKTKVIFCSILLLNTWSAQASEIDTRIVADNQEDTYLRCLAAAAENAERAMDMALRWNGLGGGAPATHCQAVALNALGDSEAAATMLRDLAERPDTPAHMRDELWAQAGQVWLEAGAYHEAIISFDQAIAQGNQAPDVRLDRAIAFAATEQYWATVDDLNVFLDAQPDDPTGLTLRGSAYRHLGSLGLALDDIDRALSIAPEDINAWLERGIVLEETGDIEGSRSAWVRVLELGPDTPAADIVRARIEAVAVADTPNGDGD